MNFKAHFQKLLEALQIERKDEQEKYKLYAENSSYAERIEAGVTLYPLEYLKMDYNDSGELIIELKVNPNHEGSAFGPGKTISLFNAEGEETEGQMLAFRSQIATVKVNNDEVLEWVRKGAGVCGVEDL